MTLADDLNGGGNINAESCSHFEDENNNELEDSISDPDYDVTAGPLAKSQWMRDMFEEEDFGEFPK